MRHVKGTTLTWWKKDGSLDKWGQPSYEVSLIKGRWEDRSEIYYGSDGREYRSDSRIGVDVDMSIGDYVVEGDESDSSDPVSEAKEVKSFRKTPNWNYTKYDRWALV